MRRVERAETGAELGLRPFAGDAPAPADGAPGEAGIAVLHAQLPRPAGKVSPSVASFAVDLERIPGADPGYLPSSPVSQHRIIPPDVQTYPPVQGRLTRGFVLRRFRRDVPAPSVRYRGGTCRITPG